MSSQLDSAHYQGTFYTSEKKFYGHLTGILKSHLHFHLSMLGALSIETLTLFLAINLAPNSYFLACTIAALLITLFSYLIFNYYLQIKRPEQMSALKDNYLSNLREEIGAPNDHLAIAKALIYLVQYIEEVGHYLDDSLKFFRQFSLYLAAPHKLYICELLLFTAIEEYINQVRQTPTDIKAHTALARGYIKLSHTYRSTEKKERRSKASAALKLAIEELKIVDHYAPNDPWVHAKLASCYRLLDMKKEEIHEVEILKNLCPEDPEVLFKLGRLYFELGQNAKAIYIYEKLQKIDLERSKKLIETYDLAFRDIL